MEQDRSAVAEAVGPGEEAVELLVRYTLIERRVESELRELLISGGRTGYMAFDSFEVEHDAVLIRLVRHQRNASYWG